MNETPTSPYELPDFDSEDVQFGQTPQAMAIITLVLGAFSFLARYRVIFWIIPIVGTVLGITSLYSLARNPAKIGRKAALIGLLLSVFFGLWASSRFLTRQQWLTGEARRNADTWLQLLQEEKLRAAHQLHITRDLRVPDEMDIEDYYRAEPKAQEDFDEFFSGYPLAELKRIAPHAKFEFQECVPTLSKGYEEDFLLRYVARYQEDGKGKELGLRLVMQRTYQPRYDEQVWRVSEVNPVKDTMF